jgi:hypothetical protein
MTTVMELVCNVPRLKVFPYLSFSFSDLKPIISLKFSTFKISHSPKQLAPRKTLNGDITVFIWV